MGELRDRMATDLRLRGLSAITQQMYLSCVRRLAAYCRRSPAELGDAEVRAFLDHLVHDRHLSRSTHAVYAAAPMTDGFALLEHLAVPTLIIRGERSPCLGERETADALASLRSGRVATIAGAAGHFVPMERPEKVAAAITAFLA